MAVVQALVVDDSRVVRRLVTQALGLDPGVVVVGTAANGREALDQVGRLDPDVVILDVEMPEMNGLEVVRALHVSHPRLPIIMFSSLTERGARITIEALTAGASDYVLKPSRTADVGAAVQSVHDELAPRIRALCGARRRVVQTVPAAPAPAAVKVRTATRSRRSTPTELIVIGASTGGPEVLERVLARMSADSRVPVLIAQHMPPTFTTMFAERLNRVTALEVHEGADAEVILPGHAYVAPGAHHMEVVRSPRGPSLHVYEAPSGDSCRSSVTVLLRSAARLSKAATLAVVLTGMGDDGSLGCQAVFDAGGTVLIQDEQSSVVWGMPGSVARAGLAHEVLTPEDLAGRLAEVGR